MTSAQATSLPEAEQTFTVLVAVGTDHHRFDRLVDWLDDWAEQQAEPTRVVFQHGSARRPRVGEGHVLLPHDQLQELMRTASVLVVHGGPATICEAWRHGRMPVVVPRDPALGEHVDGHQQRFSRRLGSQGLVLLCGQREQLGAALDQARRDPAHVLFGQEGREELVEGAVSRFGELVDELVAERAGRRPTLLGRLLAGRRGVGEGVVGRRHDARDRAGPLRGRGAAGGTGRGQGTDGGQGDEGGADGPAGGAHEGLRRDRECCCPTRVRPSGRPV